MTRRVGGDRRQRCRERLDLRGVGHATSRSACELPVTLLRQFPANVSLLKLPSMDYVSFGCCLLAFILYYNSLDGDFVYDDRRAILTNPDLLPSSPWNQLLENDFWGTPLSDSGSHGSYRPLCVLTFRINYLLGGFQPWGYHVVNVILHCLATALLVRVARSVLPTSYSYIGSAVTGLIFAAHPVHTEAVAGVVGRADLTACNFYFMSFLCYIAHCKYRDHNHYRKLSTVNNFCYRNVQEDDKASKYHKFVVDLQKKVTNCNWPRRFTELEVPRDMVSTKFTLKGYALSDGVYEFSWTENLKKWTCLSLTIVLALASMLSKETGITVTGICLFYDFLRTRSFTKKQWRSASVLIMSTALMLFFRLHFHRTPYFSTADNPVAKVQSVWSRFFTFLYLPVFNAGILFYPHELSFDWGMDALPRITTISDPRNGVSLVFYSILGLITYKCWKTLEKMKMPRDKLTKSKKTTEKALVISNESLKWVCRCHVCHYNITNAHTLMCRTNNNNNNISAHSVCTCSRVNVKKVFKNEKVTSLSVVRAVLLSLAFTVIPFLPATNLLFYVGFVVAERVLYLPSAGFCLLVGLGSAKLWEVRRFRYLAVAGLVTLLLAFSARTILRNEDWRTEEKLYRSAVNINPPKAYGNLGSVLSGQGRTAEAEWAFRKALLYRPNMADVHYNL
ncbi:transmembrane and TPR repeat-containing protein CG4341-like [Agrilus planipennis]|uniref:dolichyl-phosphate-mannose--protein mannosyltransferase n=1 Tax=Agrilus planipennis TaxID=224129 RepID=A0A1W4WP32_AGRPL|nr:transmembrane and TPR repeat-containing protein CG4341-like [Agrilus planipennis]